MVDKIALPLTRDNMPTSYAISMDNYSQRTSFGNGYQNHEQRVPAHFGAKQSMQGFEKKYRNIIDYIVRITYKIWEDRDIEYIADTYSSDSKVYDDYGLQRGNKKIITDTYHTTGAFSNIRLIADDVIWAGNDKVGYHTSHRTIIRGTNDGVSKYGPATGKDVDVLVIANCVALGNEIFLEHVLYNNSSLVMQLGHSLKDIAEKMVEINPAGWPRSETVWQALRSATRPQQALSVSNPIEGFDVDAFARNTSNQLWNKCDYSVLQTAYKSDFHFEGASNRKFSGYIEYRKMMHDLSTAFPDLKLQMDEVYWMGNDEEGYLSSERWSATATHGGDGIYGLATNVSVQIWGITQHKICNGHIEKEWMLFNELDLMMQIHAARIS